MNHSMPVFAGGLGILVLLVALVLGLAAMIFWIWALVDCAKNEPSQGNEKVVWILIIVFTHWIGALIYFLVRRPARIAQFGR
jgi:amino acid permease